MWTRGRVPLERGIPSLTPVLVIVRPGLCVFGANEGVWYLAERYANFIASLWPVIDILVTEHGWLDFMTNDAGLHPAALPRRRASAS